MRFFTIFISIIINGITIIYINGKIFIVNSSRIG